MKLIAKWKLELELPYDEPSSVVWEDGSPATMADYWAHELDTHSLHPSDGGGMECHMYPEIVADVTFEANVQDWVVRGQDVNTAALDLHDPTATNEQIVAQIFTFPTVYKHRIIRPQPRPCDSRGVAIWLRGGNMKAAEMRAAIKQHEQYCVSRGQSMSLTDLELMVQAAFPAGSLPDESDPIKFTSRELEIFRHVQWKTDETKRRWERVLLERAFPAEGQGTR